MLLQRLYEWGPAADCWALGVTLFFMVTGRLPFAVPDASRTVGTGSPRLADPRFQFPADLQLSAAGRDLVGRLLERNPRARLGGGPAGERDTLAGRRRQARQPAWAFKPKKCAPWAVRQAGRGDRTWAAAKRTGQGFAGSPSRQLYLGGDPGCGSVGAGAMEIKAHPWFAEMDWAALERRAVPAPPNPGRRASLDAGAPSSRGADRTDRDMRPGCSPVDTSDPVTAAILARLDTFFGEEKWREEGGREKEAAARRMAALMREAEARRREEEEREMVSPGNVRIL